MARFPGRTLEELDGMDYGRLLKAFQAERVEGIEARRALHNAGKYEPTAEDWAAIRDHDEWLAAHGE